jgi:hypothetical protein
MWVGELNIKGFRMLNKEKLEEKLFVLHSCIIDGDNIFSYKRKISEKKVQDILSYPRIIDGSSLLKKELELIPVVFNISFKKRILGNGLLRFNESLFALFKNINPSSSTILAIAIGRPDVSLDDFIRILKVINEFGNWKEFLFNISINERTDCRFGIYLFLYE